MIPVRSFIDHFNIVKLVQGKRNCFNKKFRTGIYVLMTFFFWLLLIPLKILDLIGFYYLLDMVRRVFVSNRKLTDFELEEVSKVFGKFLPYENIRIVENSYLAKLGAKSVGNNHLGFVLFSTINFSRPLNHESGITDMSWLVHELVHVKQFKSIGVQYVFEALRAQRNGGYNYGGIRELKVGNPLHYFNLEQQADIARHYYHALKTKSNDIAVFDLYITQIQEGKF